MMLKSFRPVSVLSAIAALSLVATACATGPSAPKTPDYKYIMVETDPPGAILTFPDGTTCETPCPVNVTEEMTMEVAKAGYKAQAYRLYGNSQERLVIELELVAPTTDVEETALPDL